MRGWHLPTSNEVVSFGGGSLRDRLRKRPACSRLLQLLAANSQEARADCLSAEPVKGAVDAKARLNDRLVGD